MEVGDVIESRLDVWVEIVELDEMFTNLMEYNARDSDGDGIIDGRSTDPLNPDTDGDGLKDGIEVIGWNILVVNRGVQNVRVTSDPGLWDTDEDGYPISKNTVKFVESVQMHRMQIPMVMGWETKPKH